MKIRIQTTQNVELEYEVAGIGYRLIAALIDLAIFVGYYAFWAILAISGTLQGLSEWMLYVFLLPPIPLMLYPFLCEVFMNGQTVGKRAMNLKVVKLDGSAPSVGDYALRWLFWIFEANPLTGLVGLGAIAVTSIVVTRYGQRIGDLAAKTTVVRITPESADDQPFIYRTSDTYVPVWPQVTTLSEKDISIIERGLAAVKEGADVSIISRIAYRVADLLGIERTKVGSTEVFLKTILLDYSHLVGEPGMNELNDPFRATPYGSIPG